MTTRVLHADAVLIGDGTSVRDGAVVLEGSIVRDVGAAADVRSRAPGATVERLSGVLLPGLINAHTHLELSSLRRRIAGGAGFVPWLESLQATRASEDEAERDLAIDRAIAELLEVGVVAVGEVTNDRVAVRRIAQRLRGTIYHELFSLDRDTGLARLAAIAAIAATSSERTPNLRVAVVPHALYSTHPDVVRAIVARGDLLAIHLAEHPAERAFLQEGGGPFRAFLERRGLTEALARFPVPHMAPIAYAASLGLLQRDAALAHLADARPEELDAVAQAGAVVVLCPRSNLHIETRYPPLLAMRARDIPIALGTDSLASSPSLDPLAEAKALADRHPEVPAASLVAAATSGGARAIGWGDTLGRIAIGRAPGLLHVEGSIPADVDPSTWLLRNVARPRRKLAEAA